MRLLYVSSIEDLLSACKISCVIENAPQHFQQLKTDALSAHPVTGNATGEKGTPTGWNVAALPLHHLLQNAQHTTR